MLRRIVLTAALFTVIAASPAIAQPPPAEPDDRVVVEGKSIDEAVRSFVNEVSVSPTGHNLARWDGKVCVGAINMKTDFAQKLIDHVSLVALAVGLEIGEPGCHPNVLIMADSDGDALAARLVKDHLKTFQPGTDGGDRGRAALRRFQTSHAAVRWWHVTQTVYTDTKTPSQMDTQATQHNDGVRVPRASRLVGNVEEDMSHVIIILDAKKIGTVSLGSLSDYVAMVALAQVDDEADMRAYGSILNLFAGATANRTARMTQWDLDYIKALYTVDGDAAFAKRQTNQIAGQMAATVKAAGDPDK